MLASLAEIYLNDLGNYVAQHEKLGINDANHELADLRIEQNQVQHSINDLETSLIDGRQICQVIHHSQGDEIT
jgi:SUMO ligase MMS21 Smc5/6 complex component